MVHWMEQGDRLRKRWEVWECVYLALGNPLFLRSSLGLSDYLFRTLGQEKQKEKFNGLGRELLCTRGLRSKWAGCRERFIHVLVKCWASPCFLLPPHHHGWPVPSHLSPTLRSFPSARISQKTLTISFGYHKIEVKEGTM